MKNLLPFLSAAFLAAASVAARDITPHPTRVHFTIRPANPKADLLTDPWIAEYNHEGRTAKFRISLRNRTLGRGSFAREDDSDATPLLRQLAAALSGTVPPSPTPADSITFTYYVLGENVGRTDDGRLSLQIPGNWRRVKIAVADETPEFYLDLNHLDGLAVISRKDPAQGDAVLRELAKVLCPTPKPDPTRKIYDVVHARTKPDGTMSRHTIGILTVDEHSRMRIRLDTVPDTIGWDRWLEVLPRSPVP